MSNERMSEAPSWKVRLDQLEQLPGADEAWKEAAWDKLYVRLQPGEEAPRKKRALWYWAVAAACLGFVVLVSLLVIRPGRRAIEAGKKAEIAGGAVIPSTVVAADSSDERPKKVFVATKITICRKGGSEGSYPVSAALVDPRSGVGAQPGTDTGKEHTTAGIAMVPGTDSSGNRIQPPAEPIPLAAAPAAHRKLRVVYINELNGPAAGEVPSGHVASRGVFPIHLPFSGPSRNLLTGMEPAADPAGEIPPLLKISLKN